MLVGGSSAWRESTGLMRAAMDVDAVFRIGSAAAAAVAAATTILFQSPSAW